MTSTVTLADQSPSFRFSARKDEKAQEKLEAELSNRFKFTEVRPIGRPDMLRLGHRARLDSLGATYRLSTAALSQICSRLAPGLSQALCSIAGADADKSGSGHKYDPRLAVDTWNSVLKLRFSRLDGYSIVVDHDRRLVEGLVGRRYEYMPNWDLYNRAKNFAEQAEHSAEFCEAALYGRKLSVRFRGNNPLFEIPNERRTNEPFFGGYHFANSETGDCSIRASTLVIRQICDNKALSEFADGGRMPHISGGRFERRFAQLVARVAARAKESTGLKPQIIKLMDANLGLGVDFPEHKARMKLIERQLRRQGLPAEVLQSSLAVMLKHGSYRADALTATRNQMETYATRTEYDLFNAITHVAKSCSADAQESAEQVAYRLLTGKFGL